MKEKKLENLTPNEVTLEEKIPNKVEVRNVLPTEVLFVLSHEKFEAIRQVMEQNTTDGILNAFELFGFHLPKKDTQVKLFQLLANTLQTKNFTSINCYSISVGLNI